MKRHKMTKLLSLFIFSSLLFSCSKGPSEESSPFYTIVSYKLETNYTSNKVYDQYDELSLSGLTISKVKYINDIKVSSSILSEKEYTLTYEDSKETLTDGTILKDAGQFKIIVSERRSNLTCDFNLIVNAISDLNQELDIDTTNVKTTYNITENFDYEDVTATYVKSYTNSAGERKTSSKNLTYSDLNITINNQNGKVYAFDKVSNSVEVKISYTCPNDEIKSKSIYVNVIDEYEYDSKVMNVTFTNSNVKLTDDDKGYYSPDEIETNTVKDYAKLSYEKWKYTPSKGNVNLLIIPLLLPSDSVSDEEVSSNLKLIEQAFKGDDCTFASLKSYYAQSSYNQLNFNPIISSFLNVKEDLKTYDNYSTYKNIDSKSSSDTITSLVKDASSWAIKDVNMNASDFDSDNDGCIDGIWVIYMGHKQDSSTELYWAFTTSTGEIGSLMSPKTNIYGWCGMDFLTSDTNQNVDTHTIIHETGHMLGLNDYYSYAYSGYSPLGTIDMMDHNVGDQNPYSKLILGWVKPYIVYGNNVTLSIKSSQFKDSLIIFSYDDKVYKKNETNKKIKFNVFDEYMILDYYTPTNLNLPVKYQVYDATTVSTAGGRLYHIDARLGYLNNNSFKLFDDPDDFFTTSKTVFRVITNSEQDSRSEHNYGLVNADYFDEIRWISADNVKLNDYELVSQFPFGPSLKVENHASSSSLFTSDTNNTFSISNYAKQFNYQTLDNKKACSFSFTINSFSKIA